MFGDSPLWKATTQIERIEAHAKVGGVLPGKEGRSWGSQWTATSHDIVTSSATAHTMAFKTPSAAASFEWGSLERNRQVQCRCELPYDNYDEQGTWAFSIGVARWSTSTPCVEPSTSRGLLGNHLEWQPTKLGV